VINFKRSICALHLYSIDDVSFSVYDDNSFINIKIYEKNKKTYQLLGNIQHDVVSPKSLNISSEKCDYCINKILYRLLGASFNGTNYGSYDYDGDHLKYLQESIKKIEQDITSNNPIFYFYDEHVSYGNSLRLTLSNNNDNYVFYAESPFLDDADFYTLQIKKTPQNKNKLIKMLSIYYNKIIKKGKHFGLKNQLLKQQNEQSYNKYSRTGEYVVNDY